MGTCCERHWVVVIDGREEDTLHRMFETGEVAGAWLPPFATVRSCAWPTRTAQRTRLIHSTHEEATRRLSAGGSFLKP